MKSSGAFGFKAVVVRSIISSFAILVHYTCIVTAFSSSFTCFWVWIGFSLALPEAAFAMIILDATSSFKWLAMTAPTVSSLGLSTHGYDSKGDFWKVVARCGRRLY
ncbi:unnamed protein product [Prunus armeniaca]|uniref:Uncharacterized protein n=1 Tax=Prunus armeniaca TaxID=36596 RepID=A0A6J5TXH0_PRUAR|nr:unnamed protein product [Prunus armeniaca]